MIDDYARLNLKWHTFCLTL